MAIIVEDGTMVSGAESFISVSDADTYHANRGDTVWAALTTTEKEQSLRKATDFMEAKYGKKWAGYKNSSSQSLSWPRKWVPLNDLITVEYVLDTVVPVEVMNACAELAVRSSTEELSPDKQKGAVIREKVDVIETEYASYSPSSSRYKKVDEMLSKYLIGSGGTLQMVRT